jgi:hypothetical protein
MNRKSLTILVVFGLLFLMAVPVQPISNEKSCDPVEKTLELNDAMTTNHQWPMQGNDAQNTCQSTYAANQNDGYEKWKFLVGNALDHVTPVIDNQGTLYITSFQGGLHAIYPNGTRKWHRELVGSLENQPVIGLNGIIYAGTTSCFHAFYPNGTLQWMLPVGQNYGSTPVISPEGIIYVGTDDGYLYAMYPNGTVQWEYYLEYRIRDVSLDAEGNIYFSANSCDYLYCLNPNGTFRWRFEEIHDISDAPLIGNDGTIYIVPQTRMVAINPDGTEKWRVPLGGPGGSPALSPDGTIVCSLRYDGVVGLDPEDGHIRWQYQLGDAPEDWTRPVISSDGTIFFAYTDHGGFKAYLSALNPDGTLRWTTSITSDIYPYACMELGPAPSIGSDGTVYITTWFIRSNSTLPDFGYIHAFSQLNPDAPSPPTITGPTQGKAGVPCEYTFTSTSPIGSDLHYYVLWDDWTYVNWAGPFSSGEPVSLNHTWSIRGTYTIQARARDSNNLCGPWGTMEITMPKTYNFPMQWLWERLFQRFPNAFPILRFLLEFNH